MITPRQIRAARALLDLNRAQLASLAGISVTGLANIESAFADPKVSTLRAIQDALESAGVEFIAENGGGPGVRLRKAQPDPDTIPSDQLNASNDE
jgi:transcriptional regulator with XRE-family HTH domain